MLFRRRKKEPEIAGAIGHFGLTQWWLETFTPDEREYIDTRYEPVVWGGSPRPRPLTTGPVLGGWDSPTDVLVSVSTALRAPADRELERRVLLHAVSVARSHWDKHSAYLGLVKNYYRTRATEPDALAEAIRYAELDIAIASLALAEWRQMFPADWVAGRPAPENHCFTQLSIIREKQGDFASASALCKEAQAQGWSGDWEKRIARLEAKLAKASTRPPTT